MSAETPVQSAGYFTHARLRFRAWRGARPFWAGLFTLLGGVPIAYFPYATLKLGTMSVAMATTAGAGSLIIGVLLVTLGLTMWFQQATRIFAGVAAIVLALVSLVVSNIGGFIVGFLLAMLGGALSVSWMPSDASAGGTKAKRSRKHAGDAKEAFVAPAAVDADGTTDAGAPESDQHLTAESSTADNGNGGYRAD
ncbi:DUF6114 domain-containing protein [Streptomyces sp. NBC_00243]|uniref:DUF6114 domain-containing protein n=1 Tax=Streptomyces sp. NBC_00243 TaxID=2975688 RepID=UPI002DDBEE2C|nr:DUF6114 domain-containing protein [Streptomyces sp. NBC_00243]WRZ19696.1 DUF6114 domain-containing protein [Streptomyces sp. NBC_00243]